MSLGGLSCWEMTDVLFKTPVGLSEIAVIELDSEANRPEQDPCNRDTYFFICSSLPCSLLLSALVARFMSVGDSGPPGSLSAVIIGEQYGTQYRVCWWHTSRCIDLTLILYVTYLHLTLHLLHCSPAPSDLLPLAILHVGGKAYPDSYTAFQCLVPPCLLLSHVSVHVCASSMTQDLITFATTGSAFKTPALSQCSFCLNAHFIIWKSAFIVFRFTYLCLPL